MTGKSARYLQVEVNQGLFVNRSLNVQSNSKAIPNNTGLLSG